MEPPSVAIVTGASGGLARYFALELSRMGTAIVAVARRQDELGGDGRLDLRGWWRLRVRRC